MELLNKDYEDEVNASRVYNLRLEIFTSLQLIAAECYSIEIERIYRLGKYNMKYLIFESKKKSTIALLLGFASALLLVSAQANLPDVDCFDDPQSLCIVETTKLPLRVIVKPQSNVYFDKDETGPQIRSNVPSFEVFHVFQMDDVSYDDSFNATGWFHVGASHEYPEGWMRAEDVVPWRQALALAFTNPGPSERQPVVMFDSYQSLDDTIEEFDSGAASPVDFYDQVLSADVPDGVVSREVNSWIDIDQTFYLMPILDHADFSSLRGDGDMRAVQLAALTNQARSEQTTACDLRDEYSGECISEQSGGFSSQLGMDAIFVIDLTASMGPYIDAVRTAIQESAQLLSEDFASEQTRLRFGLIGYRDVVELSPGIEFVSRNFTPDLLDPLEFAELLNDGSDAGGRPTVIESQISSGDFAEEVFAGLYDAIHSNWSQDAARLIILIGDASGHPIGHEKNTTGLDEKSIREMADHNNVHIASVYVGFEGSPDYDIARAQFETVSAGDAESSIAFAVATGSQTSLEKSLRDVIESVTGFISKGNFQAILSDSTDPSDATGQAILSAVRAAFVDYLGSDAKPPSNIVAWALDRDPTDYSKKAFDIKVMLGRKDMEELKDLLQGLTELLDTGTASSTFVFGQVQSGATASSYDLGIENTDVIAKSELVPKWISHLPYKSEVLTFTLEEFTNSSADDRSRFETRLNSLIDFYDEALNRPDGWILLNEQANIDDRIYMLDIANLP